MKKLYTTLFALSLTAISFAQQLQNNGFENWSEATSNPNAEDPDNYSTTNYCSVPTLTNGVPCLNNVEKTDEAHSGTFAVKLSVGDYLGSPFPGALTNDVNFQSDEDPLPVDFSGKPISISAYVKFTPATGDVAMIAVGLYSDGDSIGGGTITLSDAIANYSIVTSDITYKPTFTGTPDGILFTALAGDIDDPKTGTVLFIDDVTLTYVATSTYSAVSPVTLFTNADAGNLHFSQKVEEVSFTDMNGKTISSSAASTQDVSTAGMKAGLYMVRYSYNSNTYVGKIVLQ